MTKTCPVSLAWCKWLKEQANYPQAKATQYWCYRPMLRVGAEVVSDWKLMDGLPYNSDGSDAYACPDLEALLEWAREKIGHTLHLLPQHQSLNNSDWWVATDSSTAQSRHDPDPKQAVIGLLKEVLDG